MNKKFTALGILGLILLAGTYLVWGGHFSIDISRFFASEIPAGAVSVKDFGALGDGINDDAPAIQAAVNSLPVTGGIIYFPVGTYMLGTSGGSEGRQFHSGTATGPVQSAILINTPSVTMTGEGSSSVLKLMPSAKMNIVAANAPDIVIQRLTFDGNKSQRDGSVPWPDGDVVDNLVYGSTRATRLEIKLCEIRDGIEDGVGLWNTVDAYVHDCVIHNNGTPQAGAAGVAVSGPGNTGTRVIDNILRDNSINVWLALGSSHTLVRGNTMTGGRIGGLAVGAESPETTGLSTGHQITYNDIEANTFGISILSHQDGLIKGNRIVDNDLVGIQVTDQGSIPSARVVIEDNICSSTELGIQNFGIRVLGLSEDITLRGNECRDNGSNVNHQIVVINASAVNSGWREVNTVSYNEPKETETPTSTPTPSEEPRRTPVPTRTPFITGTPLISLPMRLPGDTDGDGDVDIFDYNAVIGNFGLQGQNLPGDTDGDGDVDIFDYNAVIGNFGVTQPQ
jgi:hypothetical protein